MTLGNTSGVKKMVSNICIKYGVKNCAVEFEELGRNTRRSRKTANRYFFFGFECLFVLGARGPSWVRISLEAGKLERMKKMRQSRSFFNKNFRV
jgi:hypothetical protein